LFKKGKSIMTMAILASATITSVIFFGCGYLLGKIKSDDVADDLKYYRAEVERYAISEQQSRVAVMKAYQAQVDLFAVLDGYRTTATEGIERVNQ